MELNIDNYNPAQTNPFGLKTKLKAKIWELVNTTLFRYSPFFARKYRIFLVRIFGGKVDYTCSLNRKSKIDYPWNLSMGSLSSLGENTWAYCLDKIEIGQKCCIGNDVYLLTGAHNVNSVSFELTTKKIVILDGVWISTGCYILPGIEIGKFSVVAAGSIVTKNVNDFSIVGGNPAKPIKTRTIL